MYIQKFKILKIEIDVKFDLENMKFSFNKQTLNMKRVCVCMCVCVYNIKMRRRDPTLTDYNHTKFRGRNFLKGGRM